MSILYVDTDNMYLIVLDLLTDSKRALLALTDSGPRALPRLEGIARRLEVVTRKGKPYADELSAADRQHDVGCVVLDLICQIHETLALLPAHAHLAERAKAVRTVLSMNRAIIAASYGQEAANAHRNRAVLEDIRRTLEAMPAAEGITAVDVAELFIGGGETIAEYLAKRADALAAERAARAETPNANLLAEARELVVRLRTTLESELSWREDAPPDLLTRLFSVLDERIAAAVAAFSRPARSDAAADAPAATNRPEPGPDGEGVDATNRPDPDLDGGASEAADADAPEADPPRPVRPLPGND